MTNFFNKEIKGKLWETILSVAGHRITTSRRVVMQVLACTETPLAPHDILAQGRATYPRLGLASFYRTLERFERFGLACRVHIEEKCHSYVAQQPGHRHQVLCQKCGRATEFLGCDHLDTLIAIVEASTCYQINDHLLQLSGICPTCQDTLE
ncbi:MAG: transcriptional repressor [Anaerolineae bacterium]|nr:transcriptional repressor [Anaerolineae bacterium]